MNKDLVSAVLGRICFDHHQKFGIRKSDFLKLLNEYNWLELYYIAACYLIENPEYHADLRRRYSESQDDVRSPSTH